MLLQLPVLCYLYLVFISGSYASIEQFLHEDVTPKCCNQGEFLSVINGGNQEKIFYCVPDINSTSHVLTSEILEYFPWNTTDAYTENVCVDDTLNKENFVRETIKIQQNNSEIIKLNELDFFPKCCPIDSSYDAKGHKCVRLKNESNTSFTEEFLNEHLINGLFLIRVGLSDCETVIADYPFTYFDPSLFNEDKGFYLEALNTTYPYESYCIDKIYNTSSYVARICHSDLSICRRTVYQEDKIRCIRKCCPDGKAYIGSGKCKVHFQNGIDFGNDTKVINVNEPFATVQGHQCRKYIADEKWDYTLDQMGTLRLHLKQDKKPKSPFEHSYCYEHVEMGLVQGTTLFMCFAYQDKNRIEFQISRVALTLSSVFLILTILGYTMLPEMRNLHGKTLMCHCGSLLVAFLILVVLQFHPTIDGRACKALGYVVVYTFLAAFMWSNIMCFDIWWTFGSMKIQGIHQKKKEFRRFLWYCLYAFSVPAVITLSAFTLQEFGDNVPESLKPLVPRLGGYNCFFEQNTNTVAFLVWFSLPISLAITCNLVLYIKTVRYWYQVKREIENMKDAGPQRKERHKILSADRERLNMAVKLFLIMGISWLFESISVCTIPVPATGVGQIIQIIFDTFNCLQGVFIFCIFILKTKFLQAIRKKLGLKRLRRSSQSTSSAITASTYLVNSLASNKK